MDLWYVIQTKPKKEMEAGSYLAPKGVEIFSPLIEDFCQRKGKVEKSLKPLFPGYIFGRFDVEVNYPLVRWGKGVKCVLSSGGHRYPSPVADEVIATIKERTKDGIVGRDSRQFKANDVVRIKAGPMKELLGIFERWVSDSERVRILLNLIGYQPTMELHHSMIEKVA